MAEDPENANAVETADCGVCGESEYRVLFERGSDLHAEESFVPSTDAFHGYGRVVVCAKCGVARLSPRQKWSFLQQVYRESQDPLYLEQAAGRRASARKIARYLRRFVEPGSLLDIGCGAGVFLSVARSRWRTKGVELCTWAVREARQKFQLDVHEGTLEDAGLKDDSFDAVTMLDVIEHLPNPRETLEQVRRVVRPGGIVFVMTPDIGSPVARLMGSWWWGLRPAHLYYFNRRNLSELLGNTGFDVKAVGYWGRRFTLGYWVSRMRGYAPRLVDGVAAVTTVTGLRHLPIYLNTFDSIGVVAMKKA